MEYSLINERSRCDQCVIKSNQIKSNLYLNQAKAHTHRHTHAYTKQYTIKEETMKL